ncbi:hypothetical protein [Embleya sp. NBC_00896]|uniref:hypothetical protein n=1 Tax=Embleya sp. NBC_00896 TaxID=2975961 RepID=UPI002F91552E|nr:immunity 22 family protein [Embleya sp. NBC_00896]
MSHEAQEFDDDDEKFFNDDLFEHEGVVAIWLNACFEEVNESIGWYDHDYEESHGRGDSDGQFHPQPVRRLLSGLSHCASWIDAAVKAAQELGITEAQYAWMLFDHEYAAPAGPFEIARDTERFPGVDPYYLGAFSFTRP